HTFGNLQFWNRAHTAFGRLTRTSHNRRTASDFNGNRKRANKRQSRSRAIRALAIHRTFSTPGSHSNPWSNSHQGAKTAIELRLGSQARENCGQLQNFFPRRITEPWIRE